MNERELLLANVLRVPGDDTARLVMADWLQENGEGERAEFIRWGIRRGVAFVRDMGGRWRYDRKAAGHVPLACWRSLNALLSGPLPRPFVVARGFISEVHMLGVGFERRAAEVFASNPVESVRLLDKCPWAGHWGLSSGEVPDVFAWWAETHSNHHNEISWGIADHMVNDPRRLTTPQDYKPGNGVGGCIAFAHESSALDALSRACVAHGRALAGLPPLAPA